ncbi:MAG TPA: hypothetical protein VFH87_11540, partial [Candidatus Udaeobacter sp.]|nr:hypothetical protein [Candidatus Udaeobacter sp.]
EAFAERFKAYAAKGDPETGSPPFVPTVDQINKVIQGLTTGKVEPDSQVGAILKSMGDLPLQQDLKTPVMTSEAAWPMPEAIKSVRDRTQKMLAIQGVDKDIGDTMNQTIYESLRAVEVKGGGKATKEDTEYQAASITANRYLADKLKLDVLGKLPDEPTKGDAEMARHEALMQEITDRINPDSPNYDREAHQRIALATGDPEHWVEAGITAPVMFNAEGELVNATTTMGGPDAVPLELARRNKQPMTLDRSIVDKYSGLIPKPTLAPEIVSRQKQVFALDREARELEASQPSPDQQARLDTIRAQIESLNKEIKTLQWGGELGEEKVKGAYEIIRERKVPLSGTATAKAVERAYNYGQSESDKASGRTLDVNNPASVAEFINNVIRAVKLGELDAFRERTGRAGQRTLTEKYTSEADATEAAVRLNERAEAVAGDWFLKYRATQDRTGAWRVVEEKQARTVSLSADSVP